MDSFEGVCITFGLCGRRGDTVDSLEVNCIKFGLYGRRVISGQYIVESFEGASSSEFLVCSSNVESRKGPDTVRSFSASL